MTLHELGRRFQTDKWKYAHYYEKIFNRAAVRTVLEIGMGLGGGMLFWRQCFPNAEHIICVTKDELPTGQIELQKDTLPLFRVNDSERHKRSKDGVIEIYRDDAYKQAWLNRLLETGLKFNIIVDDGPHTPESWRYFLEQYLSFLRKGGMAIIEDIGINDARDLVQWYRKHACNEGILYIIENSEESHFETGECLVIWKER